MNKTFDCNFTLNIKTLNINFGPQHPSAHGVLRLILELNGETVKRSDPHIGLLHRGTEKLIEYKTPLQALPYFDRLDYVSMMSQEHSFILVLEKLLNKQVSYLDSIIRIIFLEITRILNHLMGLTTHALDVGALTPFLWFFEEREKLMEFYEKVSGARMHASYFRVGGLSKNLPFNFFYDLKSFTFSFRDRLDELEELLTSNRIWKRRLKGIGVISKNSALNWGFSGVLIRSTGVLWDLRKSNPYELYNAFSSKFKIPVSFKGDSYDRFLIRIEEMRQSLYLIKYLTNHLLSFNYNYSYNNQKTKMRYLINHFTYYSRGMFLPKNQIYVATESPKGEFGVHLVSSNSNLVYRCKIRSPGFFHLQGLNLMSKNHSIADIAAIIGTQDIVFGEIDR